MFEAALLQIWIAEAEETRAARAREKAVVNFIFAWEERISSAVDFMKRKLLVTAENVKGMLRLSVSKNQRRVEFSDYIFLYISLFCHL